MISNQNIDDIYSYSESLSDDHGDLLNRLYRETHLKTLQPRMVSGKLQGRILSFISKMKKPDYILEIGTFTGYAALCLAEGLTPTGKLITLEVNPELSYISEKYFSQSKYSDQIKPLVGDALDLLPSIEKGIDLVFIDAKKRDYPEYYNLIIDKVNSGGVILADNILWDGKVILEKKDKTTQAIHDFNEMIKADPRVSNVILPLRDGVNIIVKK